MTSTTQGPATRTAPFRFLRLALFALLAGCSAPRELTVLSDLDNRPFAYVDEEGRPRGRDVEMMEELARRLGRPLAWQRVPFDELLVRLEQGEADAVCATLGVTPERLERVAFTEPYFETVIAVVAAAGPGAPRSPADLREGAVVSAAAGTTSERAVRAHLPGARLAGEDKAQPDLVERLVAGELDAAVLDGPAALARVLASDGRLRWIGELGGERYAIAVRREERALLKELDACLRELRASDWLTELDRSYGLESSAAAER